MTTMNRDGLLALYEYDAYANHLVLDGLAQLSEDEFTHAPSPSRSTLRTLFLHSLLGEAWFLAACQGHKFEQPDLPTLDDIRHFQSRLEKEHQAYLAALSESDLARDVQIELGEHPYHLLVWQLLVQAFLHATQHRAELGIVLGQMGHPLPTMDIIVYFMRQSGQPWPPK
jgi:uncharacterized damage-inducible protein DinB